MTEQQRIDALVAACERADLGCIPTTDLPRLTARAIAGSAELLAKAHRLEKEADEARAQAGALAKAALDFGTDGRGR